MHKTHLAMPAGGAHPPAHPHTPDTAIAVTGIVLFLVLAGSLILGSVFLFRILRWMWRKTA